MTFPFMKLKLDLLLKFLKAIDRFNDLVVSVYVTAGHTRFMLLHDSRNDDGIKSFFQEVHEFYIKQHFREGQGKAQSGSTRSCTKVHKQGIALGRSVDLTKFNKYDELVAELDRLFEFGGELMAPKKNWLIVYTDDEGDMMLVGDDPWQEFCCMVRKIFIYTREEVQKMSPGTLNSHGEGNQVSVEVMDAKEKPQTLPLSSIPANC